MSILFSPKTSRLFPALSSVYSRSLVLSANLHNLQDGLHRSCEPCLAPHACYGQAVSTTYKIARLYCLLRWSTYPIWLTIRWKRWKLSTSMQQSGWWIDFKPNSSHWLPHMRSHLWLLLCGCTRSTRRTNFEPSRRADLDPILHKGCRPLWWKDASLKPSQEPSYKFVRTVWTINNSSCKLSFKPFRK